MHVLSSLNLYLIVPDILQHRTVPSHHRREGEKPSSAFPCKFQLISILRIDTTIRKMALNNYSCIEL